MKSFLFIIQTIVLAMSILLFSCEEKKDTRKEAAILAKKNAEYRIDNATKYIENIVYIKTKEGIVYAVSTGGYGGEFREFSFVIVPSSEIDKIPSGKIVNK